MQGPSISAPGDLLLSGTSRLERLIPGHGDESQDQGETAPDQEEDAKLSRTLFSFLEPSLDRIGVYGAPMVLADVIALVAGIALVAFVPSMSLYGCSRRE